jgi:hypothetical protein
MSAITEEKFERLKKRIDEIDLRLRMHSGLRVQLAIDDSYYMQKKEELQILETEWKSARERLDHVEMLIALHYKHTYCRWRRDVRWLSNYLREQSSASGQ